MTRLLGFALLVLVAGCATQTPPESVPVPDTGTIIGRPSSPENRAKIHTELASLYFQRGSIAVALQELRTAVDADSTYAPAYSMLGLVYMTLRENQLAEDNFQRALKYAPNDPDINHNYGWFLCQTGHEEQSIAYFKRAIRDPLYATPGKSYASAGVCEMRRRNNKEAEQDFQRALTLQPNEPVALLELGELRYKQGDYLAARKLVRRFNEVIGPTASSLWLALRVERKLGQTVAESSYAAELRRRFPGSPEYQRLQRGDYE
ncbi:MAG: type IV pilus biogenesis/stability protein PilW [Betaproteobacteria bacterium]|nr:type IV pilus biogenesis/stability protein PilW [Betaproteobacteria bacterium]